jgi:transcriptional regulator with XRE-family HTH domain
MVNFGLCLKQLLALRGWSATQLSKALNIDSSYVRKWTTGDRVPALQSNYIQKIAYSITKGFELCFEKEAIYNLLEQCTINDFSLNTAADIQNAVEAVLKKSQIYSLSVSTKDRRLENVFTQDQLLNMVEADGALSKLDKISTTDIPPTISGRKKLLTAILLLLHSAINQSSTSPTDIYITFHSESDFFEGYPNLFCVWKVLIMKALEKGWKVHYLCCLNNNSLRSRKYVNAILDYCCYIDTFKPYYLSQYGTRSPASDYIVIKAIGSISCFSSEAENYIDFGFFNKHQEGIDALCMHSELIKKQSKPLIKVLDTIKEYFEFITTKDKQPGDLFIVSFDPHSHTIPLKLWEKYLKRTIGDPEEVSEHMSRINERLMLFYQDIERYKVKNIIQIKAVEHLVKNSQYLYFNTYQQCTPQEVLEHLQHIIYLLKTYENFEIALLSENQNDVLNFVPWEVKGGHSVALTPWNRGNNRSANHIIITEETTASAFHDYFLDLWTKITPKYRDKDFVISWFENQALWYKNSVLKNIEDAAQQTEKKT